MKPDSILPFKTSLGAAFPYADGTKYEGWQMIGADGKAYAFADFEDGKYYRWGTSSRFAAECVAFFEEVAEKAACKNLAEWRKHWPRIGERAKAGELVFHPIYQSA